LRSETEWIEIINLGAAELIDEDKMDLNTQFELFSTKEIKFPKLFGDGSSAEFICKKILEQI